MQAFSTSKEKQTMSSAITLRRSDPGRRVFRKPPAFRPAPPAISLTFFPRFAWYRNQLIIDPRSAK